MAVDQLAWLIYPVIVPLFLSLKRQTMQFQGRLKFLFGQNRRAPSGVALPPRLALFCVAAPLALPPGVEVRMKTVYLRAKHRADVPASTDAK